MCVEASRSVGSNFLLACLTRKEKSSSISPTTNTPRCEKHSVAVLGVWLPAPLPTPQALADRGALWPLAVGVEKDLGGIDV